MIVYDYWYITRKKHKKNDFEFKKKIQQMYKT